jgi:cob(I)alamin adenosyltransferase
LHLLRIIWLYAAWLHPSANHDAKKSLNFVVPQGCSQAAYSHIIRSKCKSLVRLLSRFKQQGNNVENILFDFFNLFSGYFHFLALWFNWNNGVKEQIFTSRAY